MFPSSVTSLVAAVIFCTFSHVCISKDLPLQEEPNSNASSSSDQNHSTTVNETLFMERAAQAAIQIGKLVHNYASRLPNNVTDSKGISSGKKAYIQQQNNKDYYSLSEGEFDIRSVVPYLVDNVISPLLKRFFIEQNAFTFFGGGSTASSSSATEAPPAKEQSSHLNEQSYKVPPTPAATTTTTTSTTENIGRNLLEENNVPTVAATRATTTTTTTVATTSKPKYKVRERPSTPSTRKPYVADEDDEDESLIFNKIKHL